jgi:hypothetical protein
MSYQQSFPTSKLAPPTFSTRGFGAVSVPTTAAFPELPVETLPSAHGPETLESFFWTLQPSNWQFIREILRR